MAMAIIIAPCILRMTAPKPSEAAPPPCRICIIPP